MTAITNFMRQQGFPEEPADACDMRFQGLYFQPAIVFPLVLVAVALQSAPLFLALSAVLWWNVIFPAWNPFERAYNRWIAAPRGRLPMSPAPAPQEEQTRSLRRGVTKVSAITSPFGT